jgi:hypothetical protein
MRCDSEELNTKPLFAKIEEMIKYGDLTGSEWKIKVAWRKEVVSVLTTFQEEYWKSFQAQVVETEWYKTGLEFLLAIPQPLKFFEMLYRLFNHETVGAEMQKAISDVVFGNGMPLVRAMIEATAKKIEKREKMKLDGELNANQKKKLRKRARDKALKEEELVLAVGKFLVHLPYTKMFN